MYQNLCIPNSKKSVLYFLIQERSALPEDQQSFILKLIPFPLKITHMLNKLLREVSIFSRLQQNMKSLFGFVKISSLPVSVLIKVPVPTEAAGHTYDDILNILEMK